MKKGGGTEESKIPENSVFYDYVGNNPAKWGSFSVGSMDNGDGIAAWKLLIMLLLFGLIIDGNRLRSFILMYGEMGMVRIKWFAESFKPMR